MQMMHQRYEWFAILKCIAAEAVFRLSDFYLAVLNVKASK